MASRPDFGVFRAPVKTYIILDRDFALADCRVALMVCSARNTSDKFASCRFAVVQDTLYGVQSWQNAAWVLGSAGRTHPPDARTATG